MLLVASETGHVYTFATPKLQPMITSEAGKALIQTCLHQPDPPSGNLRGPGDYEMRMSAAGFEETELGYQLPEDADFKVRKDSARVSILFTLNLFVQVAITNHTTYRTRPLTCSLLQNVIIICSYRLPCKTQWYPRALPCTL